MKLVDAIECVECGRSFADEAAKAVHFIDPAVYGCERRRCGSTAELLALGLEIEPHERLDAVVWRLTAQKKAGQTPGQR